MAANEPCCGHTHYGENELWLSADDLAELVRQTVRDTLGLGHDRGALDQARHQAAHEQLRQRAEPAAPPKRSRRHRFMGWGEP
jgi:hypothetical protein